MEGVKKILPEHFFPAEILTQILSYLPTHSLLRFRSICKTWRLVIEDPEFVYIHLKSSFNNRLKSHLIFCECLRVPEFHHRWCVLNRDTLEKTFEIVFPRGDGLPKFPWQLVDTVNGVILLHEIRNRKDGNYVALLWNPSLRKHFRLPLPPQSLMSSSNPRMEGTCKFFLGFDSSNNDHKVMLIEKLLFSQPRQTWVQIFSLKTRSWHKLEPEICGVRNEKLRTFQNQVTVGDTIHWIEEIAPELVSFNVNSELFSYTKLPNVINAEQLRRVKPMVIRDCHLGIFVPGMSYDPQSTIWVLTEQIPSPGTDWENSWCKWHNIDCRMYVSASIIQFRETTEEKIEQVLLYHPETQESKVIVPNVVSFCPSYVNTYIESLVLLYRPQNQALGIDGDRNVG